MIWLLVIFVPPLAVLLVGKPFQAMINLILCVFFWLPGVIHAYMVVKENRDDKRFKKYLKNK